MSLLHPCSACGSRAPGKNAQATWAWWRADNVRVAWRQQLCLNCYTLRVQPLEQACGVDPLNCPLCHTDPLEAMDPTYLTVFVPGLGPLRLEMATCGPCAVQLRNSAQEGATKLDDRLSPFGGQSLGPQTDPALEAWRALGIAPRE